MTRHLVRHRFEPARLLLGLVLLGAALAYVMDALGEWTVPLWVLLVLVPFGLVLAACTALVTLMVRRRARQRGKGAPPLGQMPMDTLREGYGSSREAGARDG
ncbi:hypothetical protein ACWGJ2_27270 [Streptomyces sp. NPDC054796]